MSLINKQTGQTAREILEEMNQKEKNNLKKRIYRIDHYYFDDSKASNRECLLIETNKTTEELAKLIMAIKFRFYELIGDRLFSNIDFGDILEILEKLFEVKNVKKEYKYVLQETDLKNESYTKIYDLDNVVVVKLDLYFLGEHYRRDKYKELSGITLNTDVDKILLSFKEKYDKEYYYFKQMLNGVD